MTISSRVLRKLNGQDEANFIWLEKKTELQSGKIRKQDTSVNIYYRGFKLNNLTVYEGDHVLINTENYMESDGNEIVRIINCFDNGAKKDSKRITVQWYSDIDSISHMHKKHFPHEYFPLEKLTELVEDHLGYADNINAETVVGSCCVQMEAVACNPIIVDHTHMRQGPSFICRFALHKKRPYFRPVLNSPMKKLEKHDFEKSNKENIHKGLTPKVNLNSSKKCLNITQNISPLVDDQYMGSAGKRKFTDSPSEEATSKKRKLFADDINERPTTYEIQKQIQSMKQISKFRHLNESEVGCLLDIDSSDSEDSDINTASEKTMINCCQNIKAKIYLNKLSDVLLKKKIDDIHQKESKRVRKDLVCEICKEKFNTFAENEQHVCTKASIISRNKSLTSNKSCILDKIEQQKSKIFTTAKEKLNVKSPRKFSQNEKNDKTHSKTSSDVALQSLNKTNTISNKGRPVQTSITDSTSSLNKIKADLKTKSIKSSSKVKSYSIQNTSNDSTSSDEDESCKNIKNKISSKNETPTKTKTPSTKTTTPSTKAKTPSTKTKTPSTKAKTPSTNTKTPYKPSSPTAAVKCRNYRRSLYTPTLPQRDLPISAPSSMLEGARERLHVSVVPKSLPCRENEFQEVFAFAEGKLQDGAGGCMYISGVPGTGKTATVREVMRLLKESSEEGCLTDFLALEINAMKLTTPHQLWVQIYQFLSGEKVTAEHACSLLEKRLCSVGHKKQSFLLVIDELDLLWTRKQDVMYNLFDWPSRIGSKLIVIAIANTMDLPERIMMNRVASRLGLTRMTFHPYSYKQLQEIIESRLVGMNVFESDAVQFVCRKVAAVSGDARRALDVCRRAAEMAETTSCRMSPRKKEGKLVAMSHVDAAIKEMFISPKIMAIRMCSEMEKYVLQSILAEFKRSGVEEASLEKVLIHLDEICAFDRILSPSTSELHSILSCLSSLRLILIQHHRNGLHSRIRLNIAVDDVNFALKQDEM